MSNYWVIAIPKIKNGKELKKINKKFKELYEGKWKKRDVIKHSYWVQTAREIGLPKKDLKKISETAWKEYKIYKKTYLSK